MKTVEEKLRSATKKLKAQSKDIKALRNLYQSKEKTIQKLAADVRILNAKVQSSSMFISYMAQRFPTNPENEVEIAMDDLYKFASGYDTSWKKDDKTGKIIIKIIDKNNK